MTITAAAEQAVVDSVPKGALINGNWVETGKTLDVIDPSTGEPLCAITDAGEAEALAALDAAVKRAGRMGRHPAARAQRDPARRLRIDDQPPRRVGAADDARDGQAAQRVKGRGRLRRRLPALVQRRGRAHQRSLRRRPQRPGPTAHDEAGARTVRVCHALELPGRDGHAQDRPGARRRLHRRDEAGQRNAAQLLRARPGIPRRWPARRRREPRLRIQRQRDRRPAAARTRAPASSASPDRRRSARN